MTPSFELFLVLEPLRVCFDHFATALRPLDHAGPMLVRVELYYQPATDVGLIALGLQRRELGPAVVAHIHTIAAAAGVPVMDPRQLSPGDRERFYHQYLPVYPLHERFANLTEALSRVLSTSTAESPIHTHRRPGAIVSPHARKLPPMPAKLEKKRLGSTPPGVPVIRDGCHPLGKLAPNHRSPSERERYAPVEQAAIARSAASQRAPTVPLEAPALSGPVEVLVDGGDDTTLDPPDRWQLAAVRAERPPPPAPLGKRKASPRSPTLPETPRALARPETEPTEPVSPSSATRRKVANGSGPNPVITDDDMVAPAIEVRYLRGREWAPARLASLSLKGAQLVAGALPCVGDAVRIALRFAGEHTTLSGVVHQVTTVSDAHQTGSAGFALRFPPIASAEREELVSLLRHARAAGVTIKPPPPREAVRFPLNWPVRVGTRQRGFTAEARDVSRTGMFVATRQTLPGDEIMVRVPLETEEAAVCGLARVARHLDRETAIRRGLHSGYGLAFIDILAADDTRFAGFLDRVRKRTEKRILIGAELERLGTLCAALAAVGYTVSGGSDPETLIQLLHRQAPPDAAIIDASFAARGQRRSQLAQIFASREVPCVASAGEPVQKTRVVVDQLLGITA